MDHLLSSVLMAQGCCDMDGLLPSPGNGTVSLCHGPFAAITFHGTGIMQHKPPNAITRHGTGIVVP